MAEVSITSSCNTSISPKYHSLCEGGRDASFSAYLSDDPAVLKFRDLALDLPPPTIEPLYQISLGSRKYTQKGELKIFDAEKYFNGGIEDDKLPQDRSLESPMTPINKSLQSPMTPLNKSLQSPMTPINKIKLGTPSTCSEVSWNSQIALLPSIRKDNDHILQKQASGKRFILGFGCNYCSGKRSVDIEEEALERGSSINGRRIVDLAAPANGNMVMMMKEPLNVGRIQARPIQYKREPATFNLPARSPAGVGNLTVGVQPEQANEMPRPSLEVFGTPFLGSGMDPSEHRRLMMSSVDSGRKIEDILVNSVGKKTDDDDDDRGSDSSSDLFEIGPLSAPRSCLSRKGSGDVASFMDPISSYAPSEASIEWSVVTASAADFSTAGSEYGGDRKVGPTAKPKNNKNKVSMVKEAQRRKTGSFLGCKSVKAIDVAISTHKSPEKTNPDLQRRLRSDTAIPLALYTGSTRVVDYDSPRFASPSPSLPHIPAQPLYAVHLL